MKWLFKWLLRLVLITVTLVVLVIFFKDSILRVVVENRIRALNGMEAQIGKFTTGILRPMVTVENLRLYNTPAFGGAPFLDMPELHIELDPVALASGKLHVTLARFKLAELDIVRNELGQTNVMRLGGKPGGDYGKAGGGGIELQGVEFAGIDVLNLSLGSAKFIDLADKRNNREVRLDLQNQIFKNIKTEADFYGMGVLLWLRSGGTQWPAAGGPTGKP